MDKVTEAVDALDRQARSFHGRSAASSPAVSGLELVLERAAIMQFEGGLAAAEAERLAELTVFGPPEPLTAQWLGYEWH